MKKLLIAMVVMAFSFTTNAQSFRGGLTVGIPTGDISDYYTFNVGLDLDALWEVSDDFDAGVATGYNHSFGDEVDLGTFGSVEADDFQYIPLAGAARFSVSEDFQIGADLGYAIAVSDGDGGFYYRPLIGYNVGGDAQITASYRGISVDGGSFSTINLGINFGL